MGRKIFFAAMLVTSWLLANPTAAVAQSGPTGSYQQTCRDVGVRGDTLYGVCQDTAGNWGNTQLRDFQNCNGDIANNNGALTCAGNYQGNAGYPGGGNGNYRNTGTGSFTQTCRDIRQRGDRIDASCQDRTGNWHNTSLNDADSCRGDIANEDGNLRCTDNGGYNGGWRGGNGGGYVGGYQGGIPGGSYSQTCQDAHIKGDDLVARCQTSGGGWHNTNLDKFDRCRGDIMNDNGNLRCNVSGGSYPPNGPGTWNTGGFANGSYTQTCQEIKTHGNRIEARCQARDGKLHKTSLDGFRQCRSDIINDNGNLRCQY